MRDIRSAAMVVNAKSRKGQKLFKRACKAMSGLPYPVDARAVEDPDQLEAVVRDVLRAGPDLVILGAATVRSAGWSTCWSGATWCWGCCRSAPPTASRARSASR